MSTTKPLPASAYLHTCFKYDPETGILVWKSRPVNHFATQWAWMIFIKRSAGKAIKTVSGRHIVVRLNNTNYSAHRVIFKMMTGDDPPATIDHKDRNGKNNRWDNLRPATQTEQIYNRERRSLQGAYPNGKRWFARIWENYKPRYLGTFDTAEEAHAAYCVAARKLHGEFYAD